MNRLVGMNRRRALSLLSYAGAGLAGALVAILGSALLPLGGSDARTAWAGSRGPETPDANLKQQRVVRGDDLLPRLAAIERQLAAMPSPPRQEPVKPPKPVPYTFEMAADFLFDSFEVEDTDPEWASRTEDQIEESTRDDAFANAHVVESECRRTLCRAVIQFDSHDARQALPKIIDLEPWTHGGLVHDLAGHNNRVEVFITREGYELPSPAKESE